MLRGTFYKGAKCSREQSVPSSRVFQEAKCDGDQSVSGSKVFQGQNVLRIKMFLVCKVWQGEKSSGEQSVCQLCPSTGQNMVSAASTVNSPRKLLVLF